MKDYHINIFYSEEDEGYVADIPDLKYCSAFGESPEKALLEVLNVKNAWLESALIHGKPVPDRAKSEHKVHPYFHKWITCLDPVP